MAPKENRFWMVRSKHGRDLIFETPEKLQEAIEQYFDWADSNPIYRYEAIKGGSNAGELIEIPMKRPFTIEGLCVYLGIGKSTWYDYRDREGFSDIISRAEAIIFTQKFEGAAIGIYNSNLVARKLGIYEKQYHEEVSKNQIINIPLTSFVKSREPESDLNRLTTEEKILLVDLKRKMEGDDI